MMKFVSGVLILSLVALTQCSPKAPEKAPEKPPETSVAAVDFGYDIALSLTPEATARLKSRHEKLVVSAYYYGLPAPGYAHLTTPDGVIGFKTDVVTLEPLDQTVRMTGEGIERERLKAIIGPKPLVQITIRAMQGSTQDERVSCRVFQDYVANAQAKPLPMPCSLSAG